MIRKILIGIFGFIILLVAIGFLLPRQVHVERSVVIDRPASLVFATVNSFQRFNEWSPWHELDPNMKVTMEGPRSGVGAQYRWTGNDKVGTGVQTISESIENQSVTNDLDFGDMGLAKAQLKLTPQDSGTRVTWALDTDMGVNPIGRYFGLMMDRMVGKDYDRGLAKLKTVVEKLPNVDIAGFTAEPVQLEARTIAFVTKTTTMDVPAVSKAYEEAYTEIGKFIADNKLEQTGAPVGIDGPTDANSYTFDAGIPINRADVAGSDVVGIKQTAVGPALKFVHVGSYEKLSDTFAKLNAFSAAHSYVPAGNVLSVYVDDPAEVPAEQVRTELYLPVK